jgi:hypothetical protein
MHRSVTIFNVAVEESNNTQDLMFTNANDSALFQWITKITLFISLYVLLNKKTNNVQSRADIFFINTDTFVLVNTKHFQDVG